MAKDLYHEIVKTALENEGWTVTHDPLTFKIGGVKFLIDLAAEKVFFAEKENEKIAIEIKTFGEQSQIHAFHEAIGQYDNYQIALKDYDPTRVLYLAIPIDVYNELFQKPFIQKVIALKNVKLILYDSTSNSFLEWIK